MNQLTAASNKSAEDAALAIRVTAKLGMLLPLFQPVMRDTEEFWSPDEPPAVCEGTGTAAGVPRAVLTDVLNRTIERPDGWLTQLPEPPPSSD